jgi:hypothetical protein
LGAPDGHYAEIPPGGQLVLLMEKELYLFPGIGGSPEGGPSLADSGSVVGKGGADIGLEVWSPWQDTQGKQHHAWMPVLLSTTGFSIPVIDMFSPFFKGNTGVNTVRITNLSTKSVFVDAVIGYDREAERKHEAVAFRGDTVSGGRSEVRCQLN